jgi:hypothetical protein
VTCIHVTRPVWYRFKDQKRLTLRSLELGHYLGPDLVVQVRLPYHSVAPWFMVTAREEVPLIHELTPQLENPDGILCRVRRK